MNVITIMSDEHSWNAMGCSGNRLVKTPNLDKLAAMSVQFQNAYTTCPLCAPARASWFTGQFVNRIGTWDNSTPYDGTVMGISQYLRIHKIPDIHIGKTHFHCEGEYGFEELSMPGYLNTPDLGCYYRDELVGRIHAEKRFQNIGIKKEPDHDDEVTELAVEWLKKNQNRKEPWNLEIGYLDPHFPFYVKQENWEIYEKLIKVPPSETMEPYTSLNEPLEYLRTYFKGEAATPDTIRKVWIGYCAAVAELDERIGILLDAMEELDLLKDTMILYTSDHGEQLGYHGLWWKCCMFEQSAHIPLLIYHPQIPAKTVKQPVTLADLFPTVCESFGIPVLKNISGESLYPLMRDGRDEERRDFAFSEYHAHGIPTGMFMVRWDRYKYIYYTGYKPQLFDLSLDLEENHDLVKEAGESQAVTQCLKEGERRLRSVCDPEEVDQRARSFQKRMKQELGVESGYKLERGSKVPHPEHILEIPSMNDNRPDILFFMTDHERADVIGMEQCGREVTPNLNRLAKTGLQFDRAYNTCPLCVPARTALATGLYPTRNGVVFNDWKGIRAGAWEPVHTALKKAGYCVGHVGVDHIRVKPPMKDQGFDYFINQEDYQRWAEERGIETVRGRGELREVSEEVDGMSVKKQYSSHKVSLWDKPLKAFKDFYFLDKALEFLQKPHEKPFALFIYLWAPHPPLKVPEPYATMYDPEKIKLPENIGIPADQEPPLRRKGVPAQLAKDVTREEWKKVWAAHLGLVTMADDILGALLEERKAQGRLENTCVIVTADHGDHLGQHGMYQKMEMYEEAIRVPLVIRLPNGRTGRIKELVSHLDLKPTLCGLAGAKPGPCDGISLLPVLKGEALGGEGLAPDRVIFSQYSGNPGCGTIRRCAISSRYKYVMDSECDQELYDLEKDPHEMKNVADNAQYQEVVKQMCALTEKYHRDHGDYFDWRKRDELD